MVNFLTMVHESYHLFKAMRLEFKKMLFNFNVTLHARMCSVVIAFYVDTMTLLFIRRVFAL